MAHVPCGLAIQGRSPNAWDHGEDFRWTPHPVIVTLRDNKEYIRALFNPYYPTITRWAVLLRDHGVDSRLGS